MVREHARADACMRVCGGVKARGYTRADVCMEGKFPGCRKHASRPRNDDVTLRIPEPRSKPINLTEGSSYNKTQQAETYQTNIKHRDSNQQWQQLQVITFPPPPPLSNDNNGHIWLAAHNNIPTQTVHHIKPLIPTITTWLKSTKIKWKLILHSAK